MDLIFFLLIKKRGFLEFYLTLSKNTIFKLELYSYLGVDKIIFDKINLNDNFINSLKQQSIETYPLLNDFFLMITKL